MMRRVRTNGPARALTAAVLVLAACGFNVAPVYAGPFALVSNRTSNVVLSDPNNWTTILTIVVSASAHGHACQVVASLDALNPGNNATTQDYFFTISLDNTNPALGVNGVERRIELRDNGGVNDPGFWPVSTNTAMALSANVGHSVRLLGRRAFGAPNLSVDDAVLSLLCI